MSEFSDPDGSTVLGDREISGTCDLANMCSQRLERLASKALSEHGSCPSFLIHQCE